MTESLLQSASRFRKIRTAPVALMFFLVLSGMRCGGSLSTPFGGGASGNTPGVDDSSGGSGDSDDTEDPFSPASLTGLQLWLEADAITGLTDGAAVSTWNDRSANTYSISQPTPANRPVFKANIVNGHAAVRFDNGNSTYLTSGAALGSLPLGSSARTVFVVLNTSDNMTFAEILGWGPNTGHDRFGVGFIDIGSGTLVTEAINTGTDAATINTSTWYIYSITYQAGTPLPDASNVTHLNGTRVTAPFGGASHTPSTGAGMFEIGRLPETDGYYFTGDVPEVLIYDQALTDQDRSTIDCYLGAKYAITLGHGC